MATTCVLGHAWNDGMVLCPTCGFGRRAGMAGAIPAQAAAPLAEQAAVPVAVGAGHVGYAAGATEFGYDEPPAVAEPVLSPDGQWAWDGTSWIPATMLAPHPTPQAAPEPVPEPDPAPEPAGTDGRGRRLGRTMRGRQAATPATQPRAPKEPGAHQIDPKLLLGGVVVVAALVGGDLLLQLPPLGHPTASTAAAPVVKGHPRGSVQVGTAGTGRLDVTTLRSDLRNAANAEMTYRKANSVYSINPVQLTKDGFRHTGTDRILVAAAGAAGFCLVDTQLGATPATWFAYDSQRGGLQPRTFATEAAAATSCAPGLGAMHLLSAG